MIQADCFLLLKVNIFHRYKGVPQQVLQQLGKHS